MATISWPANIKQSPLMDGFSVSQKSNLIVFNAEKGPGITRPNQSKPTVVAKLSVHIKEADLNKIWIFFNTTVVFGSLWFMWSGLDDAAHLTTPHEYRFSSPPVVRPLGKDYRVDLEIEGREP